MKRQFLDADFKSVCFGSTWIRETKFSKEKKAASVRGLSESHGNFCFPLLFPLGWLPDASTLSSGRASAMMGDIEMRKKKKNSPKTTHGMP